ncbi:MAG: rhamnogalacturonan acetylesterase [Pontiellaceae bacterium]|nr:rhamnogalacturonan acetylesterase [Pontiellaceae bacterium]
MNKMMVIASALAAVGMLRAESSYQSVELAEGNYRVSVVLGGVDEDTVTTIKAEDRRLMLEEVRVPAGETLTREFVVNIRTPDIKGGGQVKLKDREKPVLDWDQRLTLEICGKNPHVARLDIAPAEKVTTLFIMGDSTVCDQPGEPWNSWGQMLPRFFDAEVAVANHAMSGESIRSSLGARRFDKVFSLMQPGDYLFIQYGHNDMKSKDPNKLAIYRQDLKDLVKKTRELGAKPVLITPMERKAGVKADTLEEYPIIVREVAAELDTALIDLHAMSKVFYKALGDHLDEAFQDGTHHNAYGSYELAKCVIEGVRRNELGLTKNIIPNLPRFDPSKPDSLETFDIPASEAIETEKPLGD